KSNFIVVGFFSVFGAGRASTVVEVTGVSGKDITITCSHDSAFDNVKYFCNSVCKRDKDVLIKSREWYSQEKYSIVDARNIFNVTIFHLTKQDAGTYWCGWEKIGPDIYQKVVLTVREGEWINQSTLTISLLGQGRQANNRGAQGRRVNNRVS
uniref:Immunoglobulin domain-containing protein n=1 Tax=Hippocampus comes TaxID=109280 RepID=A0A3Q3D1K9_HIPCM